MRNWSTTVSTPSLDVLSLKCENTRFTQFLVRICRPTQTDVKSVSAQQNKHHMSCPCCRAPCIVAALRLINLSSTKTSGGWCFSRQFLRAFCPCLLSLSPEGVFNDAQPTRHNSRHTLGRPQSTVL